MDLEIIIQSEVIQKEKDEEIEREKRKMNIV